MNGSQVFYPFKAVGLYSGSVAFAIRKRKTEHYVTIPVEKTYQMFNCSKLAVVSCGPVLPKRVRAVAAFRNWVIAAAGANLYICKRGKIHKVIDTGTRINHLLVLSKYAITCNQENTIKIWDIFSSKCKGEIQIPQYLHVSVLMHPDTYLNKIIVGTEEGQMQLWNIRTHQLIHTYSVNWGSGITSIAQSPATDVIAVGLRNGRIILHNIKFDKTLFEFKQDSEGVTALAFRSDGHNTLISTGDKGSIITWDLDKKRILKVDSFSHNSSIASAYFFPGEPILLTSSADNSVKMWIYDRPHDQGPRLLRERAGHFKAITDVNFYGRSSLLLSASEDKSFRMFSVLKDQRSREFSQKAYALKNHQNEGHKLQPVTGVDFALSRQKQWSNIVTCHRDTPEAHLWSVSQFALNQHPLHSSNSKRAVITAVAMSHCGNFAFVGSSDGWIDKYNVQSGILRTSENSPFNEIRNKHTKEITGIHTDLFNKHLTTISLDGSIKFWDMNNQTLLYTIVVRTTGTDDHIDHSSQTQEQVLENESKADTRDKRVVPLYKSVIHKDTGLLAVVGDDFMTRIYDINTKKCVRKFQSPIHSYNTGNSIITAMGFSNDCRWLVTSDGLPSVRVWDLPSGRCIDWFMVDSPITALSFSPRSDFLATAHLGSTGIYIWANACYYSTVFFKPIPSQLPINTTNKTQLSDLFNVLPEEDELDQEEDEEQEEDPNGAEELDMDNLEDSDQGMAQKQQDQLDSNPQSDTPMVKYDNNYDWDSILLMEQLNPRLITLSNQPRSKWNTFLNLDIITERSKPEKPKGPPPKAPFFLPSLPGLEPKFISQQIANDSNSTHINTSTTSASADNPKFINWAKLQPKSKFITLLEEAYATTKDYSEVISFTSSLSPSAIDFEVKSLSMNEDCFQFKLFIFMLKDQTERNKNFDIVQCLLNVFLKEHAEILAGHKQINLMCSQLKLELSKRCSRINDLINHNLSLINFFTEI